MIWIVVILAAATMLLLAVAMTIVLGWANRAFHVDLDPRVQKIEEVLPGANCGGCGYPGCTEYAKAVVAGEAPPDACSVGGVSCAKAIAEIMGIEHEPTWPRRPIVHCGATYAERLGRSEYRGERTCAAANILSGVQGCTYGCLGLGDCERACAFDAIHMVEGLARVDYDKCTGCGACARVCPRNIISMIPFKAETMPAILCSNKDFGKDVKAVCKVGCIGCGACQRISDLFQVTENVSHIAYDEYDPDQVEAVLAAAEKCPMKCIVFVGKPTEADRQAAAGENAPSVPEVDFKTTADDTEWHG